MIKIIITIFFSIILTVNQYCQSENSKVKNTTVNSYTEVVSSQNNSNWLDFEERFVTTGIIIIELILLILILGYAQKVKKSLRIDSSKEFKEKIKALREEKIRYLSNKELSNQRKLINSLILKNSIKGKSITEKAKEMSVAKGEILLATKIQQLQSQVK